MALKARKSRKSKKSSYGPQSLQKGRKLCTENNSSRIFLLVYKKWKKMVLFWAYFLLLLKLSFIKCE